MPDGGIKKIVPLVEDKNKKNIYTNKIYGKPMKTRHLICTLFAGLLLCACNNEENFNDSSSKSVKGITITIDDANYDFVQNTRAAYTVDEERGFISTWTVGDTIGIYPINGDQVAFPISEGEGSKTAKFDGGAWALRPAYQYAAYYPFNRKNYNIEETEIPVSYTGQTQVANNSTTHLAAYDYLAAGAVQPNESGSVNLLMKHLGCFVRFQIPIKVSGTYTEFRLSTSEALLTAKGMVNLQDATPSITTQTAASVLSITLKNIVVENGETLIVYAMLAPTDLSDKTITITLSNSAGSTYYYTTTGANMVAGSAYDYTISNVPEANGHDYVDLGLPSGTLWATMNIGANAPEDIGHFYLWGDIIPLDEPNWNYSQLPRNYKFYTFDSNGNRTGITKYSPEDEKTILDEEDDVAHVEWGGSWRLPTITEQTELKNNCTVESITINTVTVAKVTGPNGNYIILPLGGLIQDMGSSYDSTTGKYKFRVYYADNYGQYLSKELDPSFTDQTSWSSTQWPTYGYTASRSLKVNPTYLEKDTWSRSGYGMNARAVLY